MSTSYAYKKKVRITWESNALLMRCLVDGPHTITEIMEETGLSEGVARGYVRLLHQKRLVAIVGYLPAGNGARVIRQYAFAPDTKDFPKPRIPTGSERTKKYRELKKIREFHAVMANLPAKEHRV